MSLVEMFFFQLLSSVGVFTFCKLTWMICFKLDDFSNSNRTPTRNLWIRRLQLTKPSYSILHVHLKSTVSCIKTDLLKCKPIQFHFSACFFTVDACIWSDFFPNWSKCKLVLLCHHLLLWINNINLLKFTLFTFLYESILIIDYSWFQKVRIPFYFCLILNRCKKLAK